MHFSTVLAAFATVSASLAAPAAEIRANTVLPPALFSLQTKVVPGIEDCGTNKDNLWLYSYHTGAGLGDACLDANQTYAMQAYYNESSTQQLFTYPNNQIGGWPMEIGLVPYSLFTTVTISIASTQTKTGFFYNETGLQFHASFGGWLVCDWWHGVPQLFNIATFETAGYESKIPKTCSKVNLMPVAV